MIQNEVLKTFNQASGEYRFPVDRMGRTSHGDIIFRDSVVENMRYLAPEKMAFVGDKHLLPSDIQLRRSLGEHGLTGLPTFVVLPGIELNEEVLDIAKEFGKGQIMKLDLPEMDQLYIRTRNPKFTNFGSRRLPTYSSRSLIINGKCMEHIDEGRGKKNTVTYGSPAEWQKTLAKDTVFMIHAENDELQKQCLHGIVGMVGINHIAIALGDKRVHARALDSRLTQVGSKYKPFLRLTGSEFDRLEFDGGHEDGSAYSNGVDAERLLKKWTNIKLDVIPMHAKVMELYGQGAMMEWRAYPDGQVHVLDVDAGF